ncbi:MAG: YtxH domain-containing protein [Gemmatimonadota bacterium]
MNRDDTSDALSFAAGLLVGMAIGVGAALLVAPQSGRRTRRRLARAIEGGLEDAGDRWESWSEDVRDAVRASRRRLER